ncbi:MAG TPA: cytochrome P450 [Allosphingosinicella sp.]|jgi:cytochrome P450
MTILSRVRTLLRRTPPLADSVNLAAPEVAADPYGAWETLRGQREVHHLPGSGGWFVLSYDAVKQAFARPDIFSNAPYRDIDAILLGEDPPKQAVVRRLVSRHFTPDRLPSLEEVARQAARAAISPAFDAVQDFAQPVSRAVAARLIGFEAGEVAELKAALEAVKDQPVPVLIAALDDFASRAAVYPQLIGDGEGLVGEAEARSLVRLLWLASTTTTERVIVRCVLHLAQSPVLRDTVAADPRLLPALVEEVMRLHPPEHVVPRLCVADTELGGASIPAGSAVFLCVGAANRDPALFEDAGELRLDRQGKRHFAFGSGIHHCVGAPLARRVVVAAIEELLIAAPALRLAKASEPITMFASLTACAPLRVEVAA